MGKLGGLSGKWEAGVGTLGDGPVIDAFEHVDQYDAVIYTRDLLYEVLDFGHPPMFSGERIVHHVGEVVVGCRALIFDEPLLGCA